MKKWHRRSLAALGVLVAGAVVLLIVGLMLFHAAPDWYHPVAMDAASRERLASSAENKLIDAQNWAAELRADEVRQARAAASGAATIPATRAAGAKVVELREDEINALLDKWSQLNGWDRQYGRYVESPVVILRDGLLIVAGKIKDLGAVASFQFRPQIDEDGKLRLEMVKATAGRLPLPQAFWTPYCERVADSVRENLPQWRASARIEPSGAANQSAMAVTMGRLFLNVANDLPAQPVVFLPLVEHGESVPVRLREVSIGDGTIELSVEPLVPAERAELLARIRSAGG